MTEDFDPPHAALASLPHPPRTVPRRPARARIPTNPALAAMGDFLSTYPWAHWCTLTYRPPAAERDAGRVPMQWGRWRKRISSSMPVSLPYALRQWIAFERTVRVNAGLPLFWFYGVEHGDRFGRLHLHALLGNTERLPTSRLAGHWTAGFARITEYDPTRGASYYITKYVSKEMTEWDISSSAEEAASLYRDRAAHLFRGRPSDRDQLTAAALARLRTRPVRTLGELS